MKKLVLEKIRPRLTGTVINGVRYEVRSLKSFRWYVLTANGVEILAANNLAVIRDYLSRLL